MEIFKKIYSRHYLFLWLWSIPILLVGLLSEQSIIAHDEGLYATRARLMLDTGDWINPWETPHHKTPGIYWLIAIFYKIFGINEVALRLPNLLFSLGCVFLVYAITKKIIDKTTAYYAAMILCLEFLWIRYSYLANPDHSTIFLFLLGILGLLKWNESNIAISEKYITENQNKKTFFPAIYLLITGICFSLMILFRGFLGLLLLMSLTPYIFHHQRRFKYLSNPWLYVGLWIGLLPMLFWLYMGFQRYGIQNVQALLNTFLDFSQEERAGNGYFYYTWNLLGLCFPWILFAGVGVWFQKSKHNSNRLLILGIPTIILVCITLYSTRISHYSLPLYPFLAILAAIGIQELLINQTNSQNRLFLKIISYLLTAIGCILFLSIVIVLLSSHFRNIVSEYLDIRNIFILIPISFGWIYLGWCAYKNNFSNQWLSGLLLGCWLTLVSLNTSGLITNVNQEFKSIFQDPQIHQIVESQVIGVIGGDKTSILLKFYLPLVDYQIKKVDDLAVNQYVWINEEVLQQSSIRYSEIRAYKNWKLIQRQS